MIKIVSIIIPVYNGEKYLLRCIDSILEQSYKNIEIIIINDGSTDSTNKICEKYLEKYEFIKLINKKNEGVSAARNNGLEIATGDYVYFVDADDYVLKDGITKLLAKAEESLADIVIGEYYVANEKGYTKISPIVSTRIDDFLCSILSGENHSALWNKLFRITIFERFQFNEDVKYMEDKLILSKILIYLKPNIKFLEIPVYVYWQDLKSVTNSKDKKMLEVFKAQIYIAKILNDSDSSLSSKNALSFSAYKSILRVLSNVDIKYLDIAVTETLNFHYNLISLKFETPNNIYAKLISIIFMLPKKIVYFLLKSIRWLLR